MRKHVIFVNLEAVKEVKYCHKTNELQTNESSAAIIKPLPTAAC